MESESGERKKVEETLAGMVQDQLGVRVTRVEPLAGQLGLRRFLRVHTGGRPQTLVARIEAPEDPAGRPPGAAPEPALEPLRTFLADLGLPVPARLGGDPARGIDLLEDLGGETLEDAVARCDGPARVALYRRVLAWLPVLQGAAPPAYPLPAFGRRLDRTLIRYKADLFARHSLPRALGRPPTPAEHAALRRGFERIADAVEEAPARLAHRDLQSRNVLVRGPDHPEPRMIDVQGAFLAPPEYDAVALLRDSYVELPEDEVADHLRWLGPRLPDAPHPGDLGRRFDLLTLARKAKDHARFVYAAGARGEGDWLTHLPATARALHRAARRVAPLHADLARAAELIDRLPETPCAP